MLNVHRPRDRSHYERFQAWHQTFYRAVEASSVTPFAPRAIDRGLAGITVALARLGIPELTAPLNAANITDYTEQLEEVVEVISRRAESHDRERGKDASEELRQVLRSRAIDLLDTWKRIANERGKLQYQKEEGVAPPLLFQPLDPELAKKPLYEQKFKAQRSLRDVEPTVNLWVRNPDGIEEDDRG